MESLACCGSVGGERMGAGESASGALKVLGPLSGEVGVESEDSG